MQIIVGWLSLYDAAKEGQVYTPHKPEHVAGPHQVDLTSRIRGSAFCWRLFDWFKSHYVWSCEKPDRP